MAPFWVAPSRGLSFTRTHLSGRLEVDVAVLGGGLTAALSAALLARGGLSVALIAEGAIADEAACGIGTVGLTPHVAAGTTRAAVGVRATRALWNATRTAGTDLVAMLVRAKAPCAIQRRPSYLVATDEPAVADLEREQATLADVGVHATWLGPSRASDVLGLEDATALRVGASDAWVDPLRATLACARLAAAAGTTCAEGIQVARIVRSTHGVELQAGAAVVAANTLVVATVSLPSACRAIARHLETLAVVTCVLPPMTAPQRRLFGRAATGRTLGERGLSWRLAPDGRLLAERTLRLSDVAAGEAGILAATGALMYDLSLLFPAISGTQPDARWVRPTLAGKDGLLVAGTHRAFPRHVFALARADRLAECALAARVAAATVLGTGHIADAWAGLPRLR